MILSVNGKSEPERKPMEERPGSEGLLEREQRNTEATVLGIRVEIW